MATASHLVTRTGAAAARPATARAIATRWSPTESTAPPAKPAGAGPARLAVHHQPVRAGLRPGADGAEGGHHGGDAVAFLDLELGGVGEGGGAVGVGRRHRQHRDLVDQRRHLGAADLGGVEGAVAGVDGGGGGGRVGGRHLDRGAHAAQDIEEAGAAGTDVHVLDRQVAAGGDAGGHDPEGGLRGVAGHVQIQRLEDRGSHGHHTRLHPDVGAAGRQHLLGVPPRRQLLANRRLPLGGQAGEQDRAFDLGARHGQAVVDAPQRATADHEGREAPALAPVDPGPHLPQRLRHPIHGPAGDRPVAGEDAQAVQGRGPSGEQADGRPRVAHIDRAVRFAEPGGPPSTTTSPVGRPSTPAPKLRTAARVRWTSCPCDRPRSLDRPSARPASSRARWEIDLSPGTRMRPCTPEGAGAATKVLTAPAGEPSSGSRGGGGRHGPGQWPGRRRPGPARPGRLRRCGRSPGRRC